MTHMGERINVGGLVVAGVGFFLTRFTVSLAVYEEPAQFYLAGVLPLALGLGLSAFGVALAVADVDAATVRTTALWCVAGAATMLVMVVLTVVGSSPGGTPYFATVRSQAYLSNFLIGGSLGGTLTGLYAARNRHQRAELGRQSNRLETLNRLLRHEVLNAVTVIRGYASLEPDEGENADGVIDDRASAIQATIEEVKHLTRRTTSTDGSTVTALDGHLQSSIEAVTERHPEASVSLDGPVPDLDVHADDRLELVFENVLENAVLHGEDTSPTVSVSTGPRSVRVEVTDDGDGLPESQRRLLESGHIEEFDDPRAGFGLNLVRLSVESYGGSIETRVDGGTTVAVVLRRAGPTGDDGLTHDRRPAEPQLLVALVASVLAGVAFGAASTGMGSSVAVIGVFYGVSDPVVGWLTHEFHSVVFGFAYVALLSLVPERFSGRLSTYVGVGAGWGVVLWALAAGVVAPVWLQLLGISAPLPNLTVPSLVNHLVWGASLGAFTFAGYRYAVPRLDWLETWSTRRLGFR